MINVKKFLLILISFFLVNTAFAVTGGVTGKIKEIRLNSFDPNAPKLHTVMMEGLTSLGNCGTDFTVAQELYVLLYIEDTVKGKQQLAALIAAKLNNSDVHIRILDINTVSNRCKILWVTIP